MESIWKEYTIGVCYYPEHWPKDMWADDLKRMRKTGISVVRIGEFSWSLLEPQEEIYHIDYYDEFLKLCLENEMKVIMGTPTATPPAWLTEKYPEVLNRNVDGITYRHGGRRHYNYNSPKYKELCCNIVKRQAEHYAGHPAIAGWQIDNELNCETDEFYSEADTEAFRGFLKNKYKNLPELNRRLGTVFWSESYSSWKEIHVPRTVINRGYNPHLHLDYYRFISESARGFCRMQSDILRKYIKDGDFITTNGMFENLDNHKMTEESLDVYMYDSYPAFAFGLDRKPRESRDLNDRKWSRNLIETRSVSPHFGIMEQQSGGCGWTTRMEGPAPRPGQLTLWAMQSLAHGADFISFFRWRTCTFGTEVYWHGILDYDNRDNRRMKEVQDFCRKVKKLKSVCGSENPASFALMKDYDNEWDAKVDCWHARLKAQSEKEIFAAAALGHIPYDIVYMRENTSAEELKKYPLLIYPHPLLMNEKRLEILKKYVSQGGTLLLGCRSGAKDMDGHFNMAVQPCLLSVLTGTTVKEYTFTSPNEDEVLVDFYSSRNENIKVKAPVYNDILENLPGTKVLAVYDSSYYRGCPAMVENHYKKGKVLHWGSTFDRENTKEFLRYLGLYEPYQNLVDLPPEVELVIRSNEKHTYFFILNYMDHSMGITVKRPMENVFTGERTQGSILLDPFEVRVFCLN